MAVPPRLPYDPRYVYPPNRENARYFLTGGLPPPKRVPDGYVRCATCDGRVQALLTTTHVKGSTPVRMIEDHICHAKARI